MKRPSFQFYPSDWTGNSNLRRCTHAEKGVWLEILCLMHDQEQYGVLRWTLKEMAQAVGCTVNLLKGLVTKGVLKGDDKHLSEAYIYTPRSGRRDGEPITLVDTQAGPIWYSSRMVKDEYVRTIRGESSRFGEGNDAASKKAPKDAPKPSPKPPLGDGSSSSSSSSYSVPNGTGGSPPEQPVDKSPDQMTKDELWAVGKSLLKEAGMPATQCGSFVGKLVKDHTADIVVQAVRSAVLERPADPASFLKATCQRLAGTRNPGVKHGNFEQQDYREGVAADGTF
ncbi:hypothetical protein [Allopusillimonas ginsengisoli]|uniref:hypothetical protein n=1 Tax=Allopusillimonas ginsengisoli TaxID=453575 RepID=UPI001ADAB0B1|nr:hypothetical protein [Allopusillimonas ginsengisoli]